MRTRNYDIEDSLFLQSSRTKRKHFLDNQAAFTAFDADLHAAYAAQWLADIEECEGLPTDETLDDDMRNYTANMEQGITDCLDAANDLKYYVKKAFPKDNARPDFQPGILREFGFTKRKEVRQSAPKTIFWILIMGITAEDVYAAELAAVNMPSSVLTNLEAVVEALLEAELRQELFKGSIIRQTRQRIQKFNDLYTFFITIHGAAQSVFIDDKERRELFNLT